MEELSRKEIVESLYLAGYKFLKAFYRTSAMINFKEVHVDERYRADILSIGWDDSVTIMELKSCRQDFEADHKWRNYLDYCNKFWFFCPEGVIQKSEIPKEIGLVWVTQNGTFVIKQKAYKLKGLKLNNNWYRKIYKRLAFRKQANLNGRLIDMEWLDFFK